MCLNHQITPENHCVACLNHQLTTEKHRAAWKIGTVKPQHGQSADGLSGICPVPSYVKFGKRCLTGSTLIVTGSYQNCGQRSAQLAWVLVRGIQGSCVNKQKQLIFCSPLSTSRNTVRLATGWKTGVRFPAAVDIFLFATASRPALGLTHTGSFSRVRCLFLRGKAAGAWSSCKCPLDDKQAWYLSLFRRKMFDTNRVWETEE
jgi:hypothetical protein